MTVSRDTTSNVFVVASQTEWSSFVGGLGIGALNNLWSMQDASLPYADSVGSAPLTGGTAADIPVTGWTRVSALSPDNYTAQAANITAASLPDLHTTSFALLALYTITNTPTSQRQFANIGVGGASGHTQADNIQIGIDTNDHYQVTDGTNTGTGTINHGTGVVPVLLRYNQTAGTIDLFVGYTPEKISKTFVRPSSGSLGAWFGAIYQDTPAVQCLWMASLAGTNAEISDAQVSSMFARFTTGYVASISVSPGTPFIVTANTQQLTAIATMGDGSTQDVTSIATWSSSAPSIATVSSMGLVTAIASGTATITATYGTSGTSFVTVSDAPLVFTVPEPDSVLTLLRLDEPEDDVPPKDALGALNDLGLDTGLSLPPVTTAFCGFGRQFSNGFAFDTTDQTPGATLATRDVTIQTILSWDMASQVTLGTDGVVVARGKTNNINEYVAYAMQLHVVDSVRQIGRLSMWWQDISGNVKLQQGGDFVLPPPGSFMMLTAVRRWLDASHVELRYYAGDQLLADFMSGDGSIGGSTIGTFCVGTSYSSGTPGNFLCGVIDELRVTNYELTHEEIAATWARISKYQPRAVSAMKQLMQPGAPISSDPASSVQKLFVRMPGMALGYAAAQIENFRQNMLPDRAFGPTLEEWESIFGTTQLATDTVEQRRARVIAAAAQKAGSSEPGVEATLNDLLQLGPGQLQILAFSPTINENFSEGLRTERWWPDPMAQWSIGSSGLRVQAASGAVIPFDGVHRTWQSCLANAEGSADLSRVPASATPNPAFFDGKQSSMIAQIIPTTLPANSEVGIAFFSNTSGNAILFGLRNNGGTYQLIIERFLKFVSQGVTVETTASLATMWLFLQQLPGGTLTTNATYKASWSTTAQLSGYTAFPTFSHPSAFHWMGFYARTFGATTAALDMSFNEVILRNPYSRRAFNWYVFRDPTLPGSPDIASAESALARLKQAQTEAHVITTLIAPADVGGVADINAAGAL